ncbi:hypothetical protein RhiirA4_476283 [Rhizophagus irregularis]|uniref:Uncharacterized protein n=1 Tax=Rhizophagus irregularis TaxID=588596 RepID=A0A2I1HBD8_9GLOM|nr:hypothetical protein RhiirA4_476283 [Rhizophagus irregularis]
MTDYDPYNDFWGDFLTGVVVTIIATRISDKTKDENDGYNNKKTKKKNYLDILDDIIIFGSLHAMNIYLFFIWWKYENKFTKAFGVITFIYSIFFLFCAIFFNVKDEKQKEFMKGLKSLILFITALLFLFNPNSITQIDLPNEFSTNKGFYKNCEVGRLLRWIAVLFLASAWILFLSIWHNRSNEWWNELWNKQRAILIQSVGNGLVLSNNFWQTKVTTALTIVAITRLIDIYKNGGSSTSLNEPDLKGVSLNMKPDIKDAGLDTNWFLRAPAWTIRRERPLVLQGLRTHGLNGVLSALGLGYADMVSGSFGIELWILASWTSSVGFLDVVVSVQDAPFRRPDSYFKGLVRLVCGFKMALRVSGHRICETDLERRILGNRFQRGDFGSNLNTGFPGILLDKVNFEVLTTLKI